MSFKSTTEKTINEIKCIEEKDWIYSDKLYNQIPTKYLIGLLNRCNKHISQLNKQLDITSEMQININYLSNARLRLKNILNNRVNIK